MLSRSNCHHGSMCTVQSSLKKGDSVELKCHSSFGRSPWLECVIAKCLDSDTFDVGDVVLHPSESRLVHRSDVRSVPKLKTPTRRQSILDTLKTALSFPTSRSERTISSARTGTSPRLEDITGRSVSESRSLHRTLTHSASPWSTRSTLMDTHDNAARNNDFDDLIGDDDHNETVVTTVDAAHAGFPDDIIAAIAALEDRNDAQAIAAVIEADLLAVADSVLVHRFEQHSISATSAAASTSFHSTSVLQSSSPGVTRSLSFRDGQRNGTQPGLRSPPVHLAATSTHPMPANGFVASDISSAIHITPFVYPGTAAADPNTDAHATTHNVSSGSRDIPTIILAPSGRTLAPRRRLSSWSQRRSTSTVSPDAGTHSAATTSTSPSKCSVQ
jgi:hypothetical protein